MAELEDPTEHLHEKIHEEAHHAQHKMGEKWVMKVALFTAVVSVLAAITGLLSSHQENEALIAQIKASDQWSFYQAKGIKAELVSATVKIMNGGETDSVSGNRVKKYKSEQEDIKQKAERLEQDSEEHLERHVKLSRGVTLFQITIAISAISILTKRKLYWFIGIGFAIAATFFLLQSIA